MKVSDQDLKNSIAYFLSSSGISFAEAVERVVNGEEPLKHVTSKAETIVTKGLAIEVSSEESLKTPEPLVESAQIVNVYEGLSYEALEKQAKECTKCRLCETRQNVVFGAGKHARPSIVFVGEGPGAEEDKSGLQFVGKAGELLTSAITKGLKMSRDEVYICNVVKCRPPENRTPLPDEVKECVPYLHSQLKLIQPQVIVLLGGTAQKAVTAKDEGILRLRGKWLSWEGIPVMPTVHPVYVLRNPSAKRDFWEDLKKVMEHLGM